MMLQERVEKSLAVYADKTLVVGAYSGYVLFIDMHSQAVQKHRVAGEIRARMGHCRYHRRSLHVQWSHVLLRSGSETPARLSLPERELPRGLRGWSKRQTGV